MHANELRKIWTDFFSARGHTPVASAGLIPHRPSAPMFTNSGMMQFVPYFLGEEACPYDPPRASSVQRCVRAGGKHNDLDAIGRSPRHLSFFEMMGNFSFGDYFKESAIPWAWEFITSTRESGGLELDGDRIWVTCHTSDDEAEQIWIDAVGMPKDRIQRLDADNFWEMGDVGPCGPCSEMFWDFGPELGADGGPAFGGEHRFVEFWNLVFTQYFRGPDGSLTPLPKTNVDTGLGMERLLGLLSNSASLYAADTIADLVRHAAVVTGRQESQSDLAGIALRLLADHTRTTTFLITDGVIPSNEDRGYVLRRVMRRAIRFAYLLDVDTLVLPPMVEKCIDLMAEAYPEVAANRDLVLGVTEREEVAFRRTLANGSQLLDSALDELPAGGTLSGSVAFKLHDTFGFPLEVTKETAELRGFDVDDDGFATEMQSQRERARSARKSGGVIHGSAADEYQRIITEVGPTVFVGRDVESIDDAVVVSVVDNEVFLDRTPFYAEQGGQVGDTGALRSASGEWKVIDTTNAVAGLHRHIIETADGSMPEIGDVLVATIDSERRAAIRRHHTATHLLHAALREVLGDHVKQQGSLVNEHRLRFDFSHFAALTAEEIARIEDIVNAEVLTAVATTHDEMSKTDAEKLGAVAFFGDKYGDRVRVLVAGPRSVEFCGGTHVRSLGEIGLVKIISEGSIGSNVRRIEATAGLASLDRLRSRDSLIAGLSDAMAVAPDELLDTATRRVGELKTMRKELDQLKKSAARAQAMSLASSAVDGVIVARVEAGSRDDVRDMAVALRDSAGIRAVVLGASPEGKGVAIASAVRPDSGLHAYELIAEALKLVGGGGSKSADLAVAGGKNAENLDSALELVRESVSASAR